MRGGKGAFLALALLPCWSSPVGASYEWRAAWGAPYPLEISEACAIPATDRMRARVAFAHPYEVEGLRFHALFLRSPRGTWEIHGGSLNAPHLTEWHAGVGRRVALCAHAGLLLGARCFNARIGDWHAPAAWTFTALARAAPPMLRLLTVEAGIVDLSATSRAAVPPVIVTRAILSAGSARVCLERSASVHGETETVIVVHLGWGALGFVQGYRWSVGESSVGLVLGAGSVQVRLTQRWHPTLGWTPRVWVVWRAR